MLSSATTTSLALSKATADCTSCERLSRLSRSAYNRRCGIAGAVPVVPATLSTTRSFTMRRHRSGPVPPQP